MAVQQPDDIKAVQEYLWDVRCEITDVLVLHDCKMRTSAQALIRLVGWDPNAFVIADLMNERAFLDV